MYLTGIRAVMQLWIKLWEGNVNWLLVKYVATKPYETALCSVWRGNVRISGRGKMMIVLKQSDFLHIVVSLATKKRQGVMSICLEGG